MCATDLEIYKLGREQCSTKQYTLQYITLIYEINLDTHCKSEEMRVKGLQVNAL